ncbi:MAG: NAD(P)H-hydrate dehydratase [Candidatus Thermoplasmatota archaeon]|nr:NAD(P)H-hydrate dehydratase [Candidatus Thermoplasmatota archaeon]
MLPFEEVPVMDRNSEYRGKPPKELMENAGRGLAEEIMERYDERPILFICGTGNNGGDAYVAARYVSEKWDTKNVKVYLIKGLENVRSEIARENLEKLNCEIVEEIDRSSIEEGTILVDALLGTGIKGEIREPYRGVMEKINGSSNPVVSVDVPSGLGADYSVKPDVTVTFQDIKEGMSEENSGDIAIKDIGVPQKALDHTGPGEMFLYPRPDSESHKGENGELLIVGGGPYTGAPVLAAKAAYRTGADLVHLAVPESVFDVVAGFSPNFIVHPLKGDRLSEKHVDEIIELSRRCDTIIIGPGLGSEDRTMNAVKEIIKRSDTPLLIDADGLKACKKEDIEFNTDALLTPHRGEFEMLSDPKENERYHKRADRYAEDHQVTLLVKGKKDYITDGDNYKWNDFGNEAMTVGGTGDTLAGVVGALMSKGLGSYKAARLGAYMTCEAGDKAFKDYRWGLMPEDIIEKLVTLYQD